MAVIGRFLLTGAHKVWTIIGPTLLAFVWEKLQRALSEWKRRKEIRAAAKAEREATELAKTEEERTRAADTSRRL